MSNILFSTGTAEAKRLARLLKKGQLRRIYRGVYTDSLKDPLPEIVQRHWMDVLAYLVPNGILSFRTAIDIKPTPYKGSTIVFVTSHYHRTIDLPGLIIKILPGNTDEFTEQLLPKIARSNIPRLLLENLTTVRGYAGTKTIGDEGVEHFLVKEMSYQGEDRLNQIRDDAKQISESLGYQKEFKKLNAIISTLLSTHGDGSRPKTEFGRAVAKKQPYDHARVTLFEWLSLYLRRCRFKERAYTYDKRSYQNIAFFESYFSNFIEGTEFIIDEAEDIVFKGEEIQNRHADSHDVLANYNLANDFSEMNETPNDAEHFLKLLTERHAYLMKERPEKNPGEFKKTPNKAGNTYFVSPKEVIGTLTQGFEIYKLLQPGIQKALFMHFLVSEVHPFLDGNGRLSRIMMNAELVQAGQYKILIPTVHRDNYINGLRFATRDQNFPLFCKVMDQAQAYAASIDWSDYGAVREKLETDFADKTPDEGLPIFNRALRKLQLSHLPK